MALVDLSTSHSSLHTGDYLQPQTQKGRIEVSVTDINISYMPDN